MAESNGSRHGNNLAAQILAPVRRVGYVRFSRHFVRFAPAPIAVIPGKRIVVDGQGICSHDGARRAKALDRNKVRRAFRALAPETPKIVGEAETNDTARASFHGKKQPVRFDDLERSNILFAATENEPALLPR